MINVTIKIDKDAQTVFEDIAGYKFTPITREVDNEDEYIQKFSTVYGNDFLLRRSYISSSKNPVYFLCLNPDKRVEYSRTELPDDFQLPWSIISEWDIRKDKFQRRMDRKRESTNEDPSFSDAVRLLETV